MLLILGLIALTCKGQQLAPIPYPIDGFFIGPPNAPYTIDAFFDHLCPDSAAAYPGLFLFINSNQNLVNLKVHIFPLPYHPFSFVVAQAGRYIQQQYPSKFLQYLDYMFEYQDFILNDYPTWNFTTVQSKVATYANQGTKIPYNYILSNLSNPDINYSSRVSWKYAASRTMTGTPLFLINEVWVPGVSGFTSSSDWENYFNSL